MTSPREWDDRFMRLVLGEPLSWSSIPGKEGGAAALLVSPDRRRFSIGYAGLPREAEPWLTEAVRSNPHMRDQYCRHAERNALSNVDCSVSGWTAYVTARPCLQCAVELHAHRIARVVCRELEPGSRWRDECLHAMAFLETHGVEYAICER